MRFASRVVVVALPLSLWSAPIAEAASCPGQPCVTVRFEGRVYETQYFRQTNASGLPIDTYYYPLRHNGQPVFHNGEPVWERFARVPAADHPDQSNVRMYHVTRIWRDGQWTESERQVASFQAAPAEDARAEAAGRALFQDVLRERQAQQNAVQPSPAANAGAPANTAPATSRAFIVGPKEAPPPVKRVTILSSCGPGSEWRYHILDRESGTIDGSAEFYRSFVATSNVGGFRVWPVQDNLSLENAKQNVAAMQAQMANRKTCGVIPSAAPRTDGYGPRREGGITDPYGQQMR